MKNIHALDRDIVKPPLLIALIYATNYAHVSFSFITLVCIVLIYIIPE
jgi:hypothetical protein